MSDVCDLCPRPAETSSVIGKLCRKHWDADTLRQDYLAYYKTGKPPHMWILSKERDAAIERLKKEA